MRSSPEGPRPERASRVPEPSDGVLRAEERFSELLLALNRAAPSRWQDVGITPQQLRLLLELSAVDTARPMQLAQRMEIHVSTLTGITDRLAERGMVLRSPAQDDRRCSDLSLTHDGHALLREMVMGSCGVLRGALAGLGRRRVEQLERLLVAMTAGLHAPSPAGPTADGLPSAPDSPGTR